MVIAVDASGSMGTHRQVEAATGAVLGLLADAYPRRDRVAMVTFRADSADVVLLPRPASSWRGPGWPSCRPGVTPWPRASPPACRWRAGGRRRQAPLFVLITDGGRPEGQARERAWRRPVTSRRRASRSSSSTPRTGPNGSALAGELAEAMDARHLQLDELTSTAVENAVALRALRGA